MSKIVEFYGGPCDGTVREVPDNCSYSEVEIFVNFHYSPTGKSRTEKHIYYRDENSQSDTIDNREIFRWRSCLIKET